jgi:adenylate kinase
MKIVFCGGIHGAGKTTLCEILAPLIAAKHLSAGDLLTESFNEGRDASKNVLDVSRNQRMILQGLDAFNDDTDLLLIDGHFSVLTSTHSIEAVPLGYFADLRPRAMMILDTPVHEVQRQLSTRDDMMYSIGLLRDLRQLELTHGDNVSTVLSIPLKIVSGERVVSQAKEFLENVL